MESPNRAVVLAALALAVAFVAAGCSQPASSEPLQVTYYYLPG
ncbi:MAG TPA: hypothetical protein VGB47_01500 [Thermoanaerobaculia bacterium]